MRIRLLVHGLGAAGALLSFGLWTLWFKFEAPLEHGVLLLAIGAVLACAAMVYGILKFVHSFRAGGVSSDAGSILGTLQDAQEDLSHSRELVSRRDAHHGGGTDALLKSTVELRKVGNKM